MSNERTFHVRDAEKLDDPSRLTYLPPGEAAAALGLMPGMAVADIGAGTGYFSIPFARRIGPLGRVFAVDLQRKMLQLLDAKLEAAAEGEGIELVEGTIGAVTCESESDALSLVIRAMARSWKMGSKRITILPTTTAAGNSNEASHASLDHSHGIREREPIGVSISFERDFVHQAADGKVGHEQTPELLLDQFWHLAAQHNLGFAQMRLEFVQGGFYLPALMVEHSQVFGRSLLGAEDGGNQAVAPA